MTPSSAGKKRKPRKTLHEWENHRENGGPAAPTKPTSAKQHNQYVKWNKARAARINKDKAEARKTAIEQFMAELTPEEKKAMTVDALKTQANLTPVERAVRVKYVLDLFKKGYSGSEITAKYMEDFQCGKYHADYWRKEAMQALAEYTLKDAESLKNVQLMRLEGILRDAMEAHDYKAANSILETINKLCNLYKKEETPVQNITEFHFGGDNPLKENIISVIENVTGNAPALIEDE